MTQCTALLAYLEKHQHITRAQAMTELGVTNLCQRVTELEAAGVVFEREDFSHRSRYGRIIHGVRYWLLDVAACGE